VFENVVLEGIAPIQRNEDPSSLTALYAGRLLPWKGVSLAIRAVALAEGWRLVVCGDGEDAKRLRTLARRLEIEERVSFRGWVSRSDLQDEMQAARVLLYPSLHDDAGWVVAEAMASGLPVICLDRGGPPTIAGPAALSISADGGMRQVTSRLAEALQHLEHGEVISPRVIERRAAEFRMEVRQRRVDGILRAGGRRLATHSDDLESASEGREPSSAGNRAPQLSEG
jgi:glycosyltransferase involved in cell wall biosynthesis